MIKEKPVGNIPKFEILFIVPGNIHGSLQIRREDTDARIQFPGELDERR